MTDESESRECRWRQQGSLVAYVVWGRTADDIWETDCGYSWTLDRGTTPEDHGMHFCCFCGGRLVAVPDDGR